MNRRIIFVSILIAVVILTIAEIIYPSEKGPDPGKVPKKTTVTTTAKPADTSDDALEFILVAGEQGNYGKYITYNKNTEFKESFYAYFVPHGTYSVTNIGDYPTQINVYSDARQYTQEGWEEPKHTYSQLADVGETVTVHVYNAYHIEIDEPTNLKMVFVSEDLPETTKVTTTAPTETTEAVTEAPDFQHQTAYLGDYILTLTGATVYTDSANRHFLIADYQYTNNSSESDSMAWTTINTAFQNGVELEKATVLDLPDEANYSSDGYFQKSKNGGTVNAQVAYILEDVTSYIEIEITKFHNYSGDSPQIFTINLQ